MKNEMTYVVALSTAIDVLSTDEQYSAVVEKLIALKASTEKRNSSKSKAQVAKEQANSDLGEVVCEVLATATEPLTITEILAMDDRFEGVKAQKLSPIVRKLMESQRVKREEIKHKAYFSLA